MSNSRPVALAPLLISLADGCYFHCGRGLERTESTSAVEVSTSDFESALDEFGELTPEGCEALCQALAEEAYVVRLEQIHSCDVLSETASSVEISCSWTGQVHQTCTGGRTHFSVRPSGPLASSGPLSAWLIRGAWEEAASVGAFRRLARELVGHGAPASLVARARAAARDEVRHARALRALARHPVPSVQFEPAGARSLFALAVENTREGCVRETAAALVAHHQARHALAPLRPVFARIARDETEHGQWSWDLDAWLRTRLSAPQRAELDRTRARALEALSVAPEPHPAVRRVFGVPGADAARRLTAGLAAALAY